MGVPGKQQPVLRVVPKLCRGKQKALLIATGLLISWLSPVRVLYESLTRKKRFNYFASFCCISCDFQGKVEFYCPCLDLLGEMQQQERNPLWCHRSESNGK